MSNPEIPGRYESGGDAPSERAAHVQELVFLLPPAEVEYQRSVFLSASLLRLRGHGDKVTDALNTLIADTS